MGKRRKLRALRAALFFALLCLAIAGATRLFERKASLARVAPFIDGAQEIDVLFVGDSLMVNDVFPMELWRDYGIASYNISSYGNTLPVSYWVMMNALDYASPRLMVIGVKDVEKPYKLSGSSSDVHTALDGFPLSLTKIQAIEDLMDDPYAVDDNGDRYVDLKWEYYFTLAKYHSRWEEVGLAGFAYTPNAQKGAEMTVGVCAPRDYDIIDERQAMEESGDGFAYLRRMIEECQSRGIDVLLVHPPYPASESEQEAANAVWYLVDEYGCDYIDFVGMDGVADYGTDMYDAHSHLNASGAWKVTDYIGRYIADHYDIGDRREDERYGAWNDDYERYAQIKRDTLLSQDELESTLMLLHDPDFSAAVYVKADSPLYREQELLRMMQNIAREHVYEDDAYSMWSDSLFPLERLDQAAEQGASYLMLADRPNASIVERVGEAEETIEASFGALQYRCDRDVVSLMLDGEELFAPGDGESDVRIAVIDNRSGEYVGSLRFSVP